MKFYYNPLDRSCKSLTGAFARGSEVTLRIYCTDGGEDDFSADVCTLVLWRDGGEAQYYPMKKTKEGFAIALKFHQTGLYFYYFSFTEEWHLGRGRFHGSVFAKTPAAWQITVYAEEYRTPDWMKGGVMYQIFPDRFFKEGEGSVEPYQILRSDWGGQPNYCPNEYGKVLNNDFFGGNLNGIRAKLDYLASLHVSILYLNPIFKAYSNHRYDTGDYMHIDPLLGTEDDFAALIQEGKERGIRIVLDGVFNHTGDDSRYFNKYGRYDSIGAYQSPTSPYAEWYRFRQFPDSYESWWGIETLPAVNEATPSYQDFICGEGGVLKKWLSFGIGGYRLDVADELPDFFLQKIRASVKEEDPDAVIIGEVWEDASNKIAYDERRQYLQGGELDSVMNYPLKDAIISYVLSGRTMQLRETVAELIDNYPKATLDVLMNVLGTHDTPRILTVCGGKICRNKDEMSVTFLNEGEKEAAKSKVRMAALLQYTLPGVPCVYYGDEIGMEGYLDPFCRGCYSWDDVDEELRSFYQKLGKIRTEILPRAFRDGDYREIYADAACIVFERKSAGETAYIYCNNSAGEYAIRMKGEFIEHLSGEKVIGRLEMKPYSYGILSKI